MSLVLPGGRFRPIRTMPTRAPPDSMVHVTTTLSGAGGLVEPRQAHGRLGADHDCLAARPARDPRDLGQPPDVRQRHLEQGERATDSGPERPDRPLGVSGQQPLRQRRRPRRTRSEAPAPTEAARGARRRGSSPARDGRGEAAADAAARAEALDRLERADAPTADRRAREQDARWDRHRQRGGDDRPRSAAREHRASARPTGGRSGADPAEHRPDHRHAFGSARDRAESGQGREECERVGVHTRDRDVRGRAVPRSRRTTQNAPKHRLGVHPDRPARPRRPPVRRQLRGQRADHRSVPSSRASGLGDLHLGAPATSAGRPSSTAPSASSAPCSPARRTSQPRLAPASHPC